MRLIPSRGKKSPDPERGGLRAPLTQHPRLKLECQFTIPLAKPQHVTG